MMRRSKTINKRSIFNTGSFAIIPGKFITSQSGANINPVGLTDTTQINGFREGEFQSFSTCQGFFNITRKNQNTVKHENNRNLGLNFGSVILQPNRDHFFAQVKPGFG